MWKFIRILLLVLLLGCLAAGGWAAYEAKKFLETPPSAEGKEVLVDIPPGSSVASVSKLLEDKGLVSNGRWFRYLVRWRKADGKLQAGRFAFNSSWKPDEVLNWLVTGKPVLFRVTIPEGLTWWQTAQILEDNGLAKASDFAVVIRDPEFLRHYGIPFDSAEGFLMPDTYLLKMKDQDAVPDMAQARSVAGRLVDNFWRKAGPLWPGGKKPSRDDLKKFVILASIVEKETAVRGERARVAGVYENRLRKGMLLQADPTVIYGLGPSFNGNLTRRNLNDEKNTYNTYKNPGLTPGPICSFGASALAAAISPEKHDFIFFVAITDGGAHCFSKTLSEHNAAVQRYLQNRKK